MRLHPWAAAAAVLTVASVPAWAQGAWTRFSRPDQGFSAEFPGTPAINAGPLQSVGGKQPFSASVETEHTFFGVAVAEMPTAPDVDAVADVIAARAPAAVGAENVSVAVITVSGQPARDITGSITRDGRKAAYRQRIVFAHGRFYQAVAIHDEAGRPEDARRFVESLAVFAPRAAPR
jgi:hypothetical protein